MPDILSLTTSLLWYYSNMFTRLTRDPDQSNHARVHGQLDLWVMAIRVQVTLSPVICPRWPVQGGGVG